MKNKKTLLERWSHWVERPGIFGFFLASILTIVPLLNWLGAATFSFWFLKEDEVSRKVLLFFFLAIFLSVLTAILGKDLVPLLLMAMVFVGVLLSWARVDFTIILPLLALFSSAIMIGLNFFPWLMGGIIELTSQALYQFAEILEADYHRTIPAERLDLIVDLLPVTLTLGCLLLSVVTLLISRYMLRLLHHPKAATIDVLAHRLKLSSIILFAVVVVLSYLMFAFSSLPSPLFISTSLLAISLVPFALIIEQNILTIPKVAEKKIKARAASWFYRFLLVIFVVLSMMPLNHIGSIGLLILTGLPIILDYFLDFYHRRVHSLQPTNLQAKAG